MTTDFRHRAPDFGYPVPQQSDPGTPGKRTLTGSIARRPQIVFRVESAEAAQVFADAFGPRDRNGVAQGADAAVDRAASSSGSPLPEDLRGRFESSLFADLSSVRIHTGSESAEASSAVGAKAYTTGQDIHFGAGQYNPSSASGVHLLAHEVAHTVQQQGTTPTRQNKLEVSAPQDSAELEADHAADAMVAGRAIAITARAGIVGQEGITMGQGAQCTISRDVDKDMVDAGKWVGDSGANDARVQVIMGHTTTADEKEAGAIISQIDAAEQAVQRHPKALIRGDGSAGPLKGIQTENVDARYVLQTFMATASDSGDFQSQYAASYSTSKRDYGEFIGMYTAFQAAGGALNEGGQKSTMAGLSKDAEFVRARTEFHGVRDHLETDRNKIKEGQLAADAAKDSLTATIHNARAAAAGAKVDKKKSELAKVMQTINDVVSVIMTVGKIAAAATTGVLAMGGGADASKLIDSNPEIAPPPGGAPKSPSLAPPDVRRFVSNPDIALPEDGMGVPNDTRTSRMPSQTLETMKGLGKVGVDVMTALGGPEAMLKQAITMLEQSKIDQIQADIEAAQEDHKLNAAAAAAKTLKEKRTLYQEKMTTLINNVTNLLNHKKQMDTAVDAMVAAAKAKGAGKDLTGAIRLVGAGDKFLSQIDLTISLGNQQQAKGRDAKVQRYNINDGPFGSGTAQGVGQLHYWTVARDAGLDDFLAAKHQVTLQASGKDSLTGDQVSNSTQFDVGKSVEELQQWKIDVRAMRDQAQSALGVGVASGAS